MDTKSKLIELAAQMVLGDNMPSTYYEDWKWPKGMQVTSWRKVHDAAVKSQEQCRLWGVALGKIIDDIDEEITTCECSWSEYERGDRSGYYCPACKKIIAAQS